MYRHAHHPSSAATVTLMPKTHLIMTIIGWWQLADNDEKDVFWFSCMCVCAVVVKVVMVMLWFGVCVGGCGGGGYKGKGWWPLAGNGASYNCGGPWGGFNGNPTYNTPQSQTNSYVHEYISHIAHSIYCV